MFNILQCDLFLEHESCCYANYADYNIPYAVTSNKNLTNITQRLYNWFSSNQMKVYHEKCKLLVSTEENAIIQIANTSINCSRSQGLLGIAFDNKLKFEKHMSKIK